MAGLSVAHKVALAALLERCPDSMLRTVSSAVGTLPGERAAELRLMLAEETRDRVRRAFVLAPLLPMFRQRADGVSALLRVRTATFDNLFEGVAVFASDGVAHRRQGG